MHRSTFFGFFRTLLPIAAVLTFLLPGTAGASEPFSGLRLAIYTDFLQPLTPTHHLESAAQRSVVVPMEVQRPTQGANVMTATDCSMSRSFDGILDNERPARSAMIGSIGRIV